VEIIHAGTVVGKLEGDRESTLGFVDLLRQHSNSCLNNEIPTFALHRFLHKSSDSDSGHSILPVYWHNSGTFLSVFV
jgi:hypothetical protein